MTSSIQIESEPCSNKMDTTLITLFFHLNAIYFLFLSNPCLIFSITIEQEADRYNSNGQIKDYIRFRKKT